jgi:hypothetical protein
MESNETAALEQRREFTEVVGLFDSLDNLQSAIDYLMTHGFDRSEISLLTEDAKAREKVGSKGSVEIEDSDEAPRISYIESESLNEGKAALIGLLFYVGAVAARSPFGPSTAVSPPRCLRALALVWPPAWLAWASAHSFDIVRAIGCRRN